MVDGPSAVSATTHQKWRGWLQQHLHSLWNRGLPPHVNIALDVGWPLLFIPIALINQLLTPHLAWLVLLVVLTGIYALAWFWVHRQALRINLERTQQGAILVAGDRLSEEFTLHNHSSLPLLWAEIDDQSDLPGYQPGRVVGCDANNQVAWRATAECRQRGVFRLGPHTLKSGDPFGLFSLTIHSDQTQKVLVYPRVVQLPSIPIPRGENAGSERRRHPFAGVLPSASVRQHTTFDSLRFVHWRSSAHRGQLMVKELEQEPGGELWIVPDLQAASHVGEGEQGTFETTIIAAASLAAELLGSHERRSVGLLAVSGVGDAMQTILIPPQPGPAQMWHILAALAPLKPTDRPLDEVIRQQRSVLGRRRSLIVVAPFVSAAEPTWLSELISLRSQELSACVLGILPAAATTQEEKASEGREGLQLLLASNLARYDVPTQTLAVGTRLRPLITFRRRRTELRSTPTGGVVRVEVEEEVG